MLNFAPAMLTVPEGVTIRKVDLAIGLQNLSCYEQRDALRELKGPAGKQGGAIADHDPDHDRDDHQHDHQDHELDGSLIKEGVSIPSIVFTPPYAGPYQGGALPPVRKAFRERSARLSSGRWIANSRIEATRNISEYRGTLPLL